jgi:MoaA/NifB/PqqE/SkfB family radical SAM enzyme
MRRGHTSSKVGPMRNKMAEYRRAQGNYFLQGKPVVEAENGCKIYSLVTPPSGSRVARRRVRLILDNLASGSCGSNPIGNLPMDRTPHVVTLAVTYDCQCDCRHCSAASFQEEVRRRHNALSFDELRSTIEQAVDLGSTCVVLTGGEPLLYQRIFDLIAAVDKTRSVCTVFTNGEYLTEAAVARLKEAGVFGVYVSLDRPFADGHDENRGRPGLFEQAVQGLRRCQIADIATGISTYATKENLRNGELDAMMDLAKFLRVIEVFIFDVIPAGRLRDHPECVLDEGEADALREFRSKYTECSDYPGIIHQSMFSSIAYPCVAEGCPAGMVTAHVRANGDVCPCDFTPHAFGNIRGQSLKEIWKTMSAHDLYAKASARCRLSQPAFWEKLHALSPVKSSH